jgi:putative ABC transport system permease protein
MARFTRFRRMFGLEPKADVDAELSFHLEMRSRELIAAGETPERARRRALQRFGDIERTRRECVTIDERRKRHMTMVEFIRELQQDLGYAVRTLARTPAFTAAALVTLALGIGANSAIFSVVNGVLLQSLPYPNPERLHVVQMLYPDGTKYSTMSAPDFMSLREHPGAFARVEASAAAVITVLGAGEPREVDGAFVSDGFFDMLGVRVALGRGFAAAEHRPGQGTVAILSHGFWQRAFGGDAAVLGRSIAARGNHYTIVGVLAPEAELPDPADLIVPLVYDEAFDASTPRGRRAEFLSVLGAARAGVAPAAINSELARLGETLQRQFPRSNGGLQITSTPLTDTIVGDVRRPLFVLLGAVGFVLLVACANVASLLLARGSARHGELSVRAALGAGRFRLIRQLVTESLLLGVIGGAIGLGLAYWSTSALIAARPADLPRLEHIRLDGTVALFTFGAAMLTSFVCGVVSAMQATADHLLRGLQPGGRSQGGRPRTQRLRAALVVAEMALAVVLLTGAGLMIRSFVALTDVDPGFQPGGAVSVRVSFQGADYQEDEAIRARLSLLLERLRALPGVTAVAAGNTLPLSGEGAINDFAVDGAAPPPPDVNQEIAVASITPDYFEAIGAPLKRGRLFTNLDQPDTAAVALLNEAAVKRWFPNEDPIGKRVLSGGPREVVGIVGDVRQRSPGLPAIPQLFVPYSQGTSRTVRIVVRADADPLALAPSIREQIRRLDPNLPLADAVPLQDTVARAVARPRFYMSLLALFAAVALALSATGIFGVMSYSVAQQSKEIGIRMALGARASEVVRSVVGRALALAGGGVVIGIAASLALGGVIRNQLFGVTVFDPATIAAATIVLLASAAMASLLPAARAARIDPIKAFREV